MWLEGRSGAGGSGRSSGATWGLLRYELHASRVDRIWRLVDMSYDVVEEHLEEGDPQVALRLLGLAAGRLTDTSGDALQHEQREHLELPDPAEDGPSDEE